MKVCRLTRYLSLFFVLIFMVLSSRGQKILVLENVRSLKNFKYHQFQDIILHNSLTDKKIYDVIVDMTDSSLVLNMCGEVRFEHIDAVYRELWLVKTLSALSLIGGTAYFGIDSFNRLINHEWPVVDEETLIISGGLVVFSAALLPFRYRIIHPGDKWQLKMIDTGGY